MLRFADIRHGGGSFYLRLAMLSAFMMHAGVSAQINAPFIESHRLGLPPNKAGLPSCRLLDVDADGDLDVILTGGINGNQDCYLNDGRGGWQTRRLPLIQGITLDIGDIDGDGDPDLLFPQGNRFELLENKGGGRFVNATSARLPLFGTGGSAIGGLLVDIDNDGDLDILGSTRFSATGVSSIAYINDGNGRFVDASQAWGMSNIKSGGITSRWRHGDMDGDGDQDLVVRGWYGVQLIFNHNRTMVDEGIQRLSKAPCQTGLVGSLALGDIDGDGDIDIFTPANGWGEGELFQNDGTGWFTDITPTHLPFPLARLSKGGLDPWFIDLDGDGDLDLVNPTIRTDWFPHELYFNDGTGRFSVPNQPLLPPRLAQDTKTGVQMLTGDVDGDGDRDFIRISPNSTISAWPSQTFLSLERQLEPVAPPVIGMPFGFKVWGEPGDLVGIWVSAKAASVPLPVLGTLGIDTQQAVPLTSVPTVAGNREASVLFPIPNDPGLVGLQLYSQALLLNLINLSTSRLTATIGITIK